MNVRLTREEQLKLNLSEKLVLFYRAHPCEAAEDLLGIKLCWFQRKALRDMWFKKNTLLLMSRGIGKTWLLALFVILYALLYPGVKIGVITPSFKQTEFLFDKIADFYESSMYFRAAADKYQRTTYKAFVKFQNLSFIEGLPLGTGEKIRGRRYNIVVIDEYAFVDEEIIKKVIRPMMNVKTKGVENKYIIASTAYYSWNHLYMQYLLYNVMSITQPDKYALHEYIFEDVRMIPDPPFDLDYELYEMMRMDTTNEIYSMENICLTDKNRIICKDVVKNIDKVTINDYVLSGSGYFERVLKTNKRQYSGEIIKIGSWKNGEMLETTPEHPILVSRNGKILYEEAKNITLNDYLVFQIPKNNEVDYDIEKAYILGLYLAEGQISENNNKSRFDVPRNKRYNLKQKRKKQYSLFFHINEDEIDLKERIESYLTRIDERIGYNKCKTSKCLSIGCYFSEDEIYKFVDFMKIGNKSYIKKIPDEIFTWKKENIIAFIKGVFDGDGYIRTESVSMDLVSEDVITKMKYLLSMIGIQSSIFKMTEKGEGYVNGLKCNLQPVWRLNISGINASRFLNLYDIQKTTKNTPGRDKGFIDDNYVYYKIKSIETEDFNGFVYNLEIENDPSYLTSVSQVHNCQFPIENVGFFTARLIDQCTPKATEDADSVCPMEYFGDKGTFYVMGIDAARVAGGDNFSISILKLQNGIKRHVFGFTLNGSPYQEMIFHIRRLMQEFNIVQINMDSAGGGTTIKDLLAQPYKMIDGKTLPAILDMDDKLTEEKEGIRMLRMVNFTKPEVNDLYMRLKADMQHKTIQFPIDLRHSTDRELEKVAKEILETKRELLVLQAEGKGNYYQFSVPSQFKKDRATSLTLANQAANDYFANFKQEIAVELGVGFWLPS